MKAAKFALLFLSLSLSSSLAYGSQVLVNGGFETGSISPWTNDTRYGTGGWTVTSTGCYAGNYCAIDVGDVGLKQTFAGVSTSTITDVQFYFNNAIGGTAYDFFYSGGGDDEFSAGGTTNMWDLVDGTANLRSNATLVGFEVFGYSGGPNGPTLLDNLSITTNSIATTPEPSALWLALTGLGPLATKLLRGRSKRK